MTRLLWASPVRRQMPSRNTPNNESSPKNNALVYEFSDDLSACLPVHRTQTGNAQADGCSGYDDPPHCAKLNLFLYPSTGHRNGLTIPHLHGDKYLSIPWEKSGYLLHIIHLLIMLL